MQKPPVLLPLLLQGVSAAHYKIRAFVIILCLQYHVVIKLISLLIATIQA